jgi:CheY-like chemotaxis protein
MAIIRRNVEQEVRLIDDLLDVTRITHGKIGLKREALDLHTVLEETVAGRVAEVQRAGLTATLDLRAARHIVVGDAVRLRQVVWNLLNNALRYTGSGGHVTLRTENPSPDSIDLVVEDTGQGLDPSMLDRIFAPFDQASPDHEHRGGLGLGLTICKGLTEAHGGHISAHSAGIGHGATFVVSLPATGNLQNGPRGAEHVAEARPHRALRILVLEDSRDSADAIAMALRLRGHRVCVAHRVHDALALKDEPFDVLVSDLSLPDGTGLDAMRAFRASAVRGVALSGFGTMEDVQKSHDAGFAHHLTKPVHLDALIETVEQTD